MLQKPQSGARHCIENTADERQLCLGKCLNLFHTFSIVTKVCRPTNQGQNGMSAQLKQPAHWSESNHSRFSGEAAWCLMYLSEPPLFSCSLLSLSFVAHAVLMFCVHTKIWTQVLRTCPAWSDFSQKNGSVGRIDASWHVFSVCLYIKNISFDMLL